MIINLGKNPLATFPQPAAPYTGQGGYVRLFDPLGGTVVRLPWMPEEIETSNLAQAWTQLARPGRVPLLMSQGRNLPTVNLPFRLIHPGGTAHVQGTLDALDKLARSSNPLRLDVASQYRGLFRITAMGVVERTWARDGKPTDAEVTLELTRSSDMVIAVGPIKRKTKKSKASGTRGRLKGGARNV